MRISLSASASAGAPLAPSLVLLTLPVVPVYLPLVPDVLRLVLRRLRRALGSERRRVAVQPTKRSVIRSRIACEDNLLKLEGSSVPSPYYVLLGKTSTAASIDSVFAG